MPDGYILSDKDKEVLKKWVEENKHLFSNTSGRPAVPEPDGVTIDIHVARTPTGGIPALTEASGTAIDDVPGSAECEIYRLITNDTGTKRLSTTPVYKKTVYNISTTAIPAAVWVLIKRDKFGEWYAERQNTTTEETDPENEELPGDCGGCGWIAALEVGMCLYLTERFRGGKCGCYDYRDHDQVSDAADLYYNVNFSGAGATWSLISGTYRANVVAPSPTDKTQPITFTGWGGALIADDKEVPDNANILGIQFDFNAQDSNLTDSKVREFRIQLRDSGGLIGTNKSTGATIQHSSGGSSLRSYGGATDLWGLTDLTGAAFNDNDFGFEAVFESTDGTSRFVDLTGFVIHVWYEAPVPPLDHVRMRTIGGNIWTVSETDPDTGLPYAVRMCGVDYAFRFLKDDGTDSHQPAAFLTGPAGSGGTPEYKGILNKCGLHWATFTFYDDDLCTNDRNNLAGPLGNMLCLEVRWGQCYFQEPTVSCCNDAEVPVVPKILCLKLVGEDQTLYPPHILEDGVMMTDRWAAPFNFYYGFGCGANPIIPDSTNYWGIRTWEFTDPGTLSYGRALICPVVNCSFNMYVNFLLSLDLFAGGSDDAYRVYAWSPDTGCEEPTTVKGPWGAYEIPRTLYCHLPGACALVCGDDPITLVTPDVAIGGWSGSVCSGDVVAAISYCSEGDAEWAVDVSPIAGTVTGLAVSYDPFILEFDVVVSPGNLGCPAGTYHVMITEAP